MLRYRTRPFRAGRLLWYGYRAHQNARPSGGAGSAGMGGVRPWMLYSLFGGGPFGGIARLISLIAALGLLVLLGVMR